MIFEVNYTENGDQKTMHFTGSTDAFCAHLKQLFKDPTKKIWMISMDEEIVLTDLDEGYVESNTKPE